MGKHIKFRMCRLIPSFSSCSSKHPSTLPSNPVPLYLRFSPVNPHPMMLHYPTKPKTLYSSLKRHISSAITSFACGCSSRSTSECLSQTDHSKSPPTAELYWKKEDRYHVAQIFDETPPQKIYNSSASGNTSCDEDVLLPTPPLPPNTGKKKRRPRRKKRTPTLPKNRISTSSGIDSELFSSGGYADDYDLDGEETETLVTTSRSLSTDYSSSEFNAQSETIRETPLKRAVAKRKKKKVKNVNRCVLKTNKVTTENGRLSSPEMDTPARLSLFLKRLMPCALEGKVRDSFAVVKKSEDPYEDFKRSMLEMILEKEMFEEKDLEQLLECFLSLNSRQHHEAIVRAFSEIWDTLFRRRSSSFRASTSL